MKYEYGMYGGKFCPMHKGHLHCVDFALTKCEKLYLILFSGGTDENRIENSETTLSRNYLSLENRKAQLQRVAEMYDGRVIPVVCDISACRYPDGSEDWEAETPIVLAACPERFTAVFGSEPSYAEYFKNAYPWADYIMVDNDRADVPISATKVRAMNDEEAKKWII